MVNTSPAPLTHPSSGDDSGRQRSGARGFTLVESVLSTLVLAIAVLAVGSAFSSGLHATKYARELTHATWFLEETMASLDEQEYDNLLAMDGNVFIGAPNTLSAGFSISLVVSQFDVDIVQLVAVLNDRHNGREMTRVASYRSRR